MLSEATYRSLLLSGTVSLIAGAVGAVLAWLLTRTRIPGRRFLSGMISVPYALPPYLLGMAWLVLGNPTVGLIKDWLPASGTYGFWGMALVLASATFAYPYLELRAGFERLDPALEEAARIGGARPWQVFRDVSLPLLWPSLLNGMGLAFLTTLAAFGVPALLGLPVRQPVLTTQIYGALKLGGDEGLNEAFRLSAELLAITLVVLALLAGVRRWQARGSGALGGGKSSRPSLVELGAWRWPVAVLAWGFFFLTVILPWGVIGVCALSPVAGKYAPAGWTLKNLGYVLGLADFQEALWNSLLLSAGAATLVASGGFLLGYLAVRRVSTRLGRLARWRLEALGLPFSLPGSVIAIVLIVTTSRLGMPALALIGLGYVIKYAAVGGRLLVTAYSQVHPSLEEAARVSGARTWGLLFTIWLPLLKNSLGAAWLLAFLPMLTELNMSVLLTGPGAATLGTVLFQLQEYADPPSAAALGWILLTVALAVGIVTRPRERETS